MVQKTLKWESQYLKFINTNQLFHLCETYKKLNLSVATALPEPIVQSRFDSVHHRLAEMPLKFMSCSFLAREVKLAVLNDETQYTAVFGDNLIL